MGKVCWVGLEGRRRSWRNLEGRPDALAVFVLFGGRIWGVGLGECVVGPACGGWRAGAVARSSQQRFLEGIDHGMVEITGGECPLTWFVRPGSGRIGVEVQAKAGREAGLGVSLVAQDLPARAGRWARPLKAGRVGVAQ